MAGGFVTHVAHKFFTLQKTCAGARTCIKDTIQRDTNRKTTEFRWSANIESLTLVVPDDLSNMLRELRHISIKEFHSTVKSSSFLVERHRYPM